jgi:hypothetical protein
MGRNLDADKTPLLQNAEENIGNSVYVQPQAGNVGIVIPTINPARIVNLAGGSAAGQTTTIIMTVSRILQGEQNPNPGLPGPITGIVDFGNGGRSTRVEFDVPPGPFTGFLTSALTALEPQDGGVLVTVPTAIVRAYARYDNLLLAPVLNTNPPASMAQVHGVAVVGPGGPLNNVPAEPVLAKAMAAYFSRSHAKVYKTLYLYVSNPIPPAPISVGDPVAGTFDNFCLPAFAKTLKILRRPSTASIDVRLSDNVRNLEDFTVASTPAPVIPLSGRETIISLKSTTANPADQVTFLALSCEIGV